MEFVRGNVALRDHTEAGEDVHLFEQVAGGLRYVGQFVCAGYDERENVPDRNGDARRAIVFELVALDDQLAAPHTELERSAPAISIVSRILPGAPDDGAYLVCRRPGGKRNLPRAGFQWS